MVELPGDGEHRISCGHGRPSAGSSRRPGGDEYTQAKAVFAKLGDLVEAARRGRGDIVKVTVFAIDINQREKVWQARREFFTGDFPASTLVQMAALAEPSLKVEIEALAHVGASRR